MCRNCYRYRRTRPEQSPCIIVVPLGARRCSIPPARRTTVTVDARRASRSWPVANLPYHAPDGLCVLWFSCCCSLRSVIFFHGARPRSRRSASPATRCTYHDTLERNLFMSAKESSQQYGVQRKLLSSEHEKTQYFTTQNMTSKAFVTAIQQKISIR